MSRVRGAVALLATVGVVAVGGALPSRAQTPPAPVASPPTTRGLLEEIVTNLVKPPPPPAPAAVAPPAPLPAKPLVPVAPVVARPSGPAPPPARVVPSQFTGAVRTGPRTGPRNTVALLDALRRLEDVGLRPEEAAILGMGRFPVAGRANWSDDWLDPRFNPTFHQHQGTDIFAARGTPVRAPAEGTVRFADEGVGGKSAYVTTADGTFYYMTHLNDFNRKVRSGARVRQGEVVGFVGNTGNAAGGAPHVHFEIHPRGGAAVNPKPVLDGWLADALAAVPALLASRNVNLPRPLTDTGALRRLEEPSPGSSAAGVAPVLWSSSVGARGVTLSLAQVAAARAVGRIDWAERSSVEQARADDLRTATATARLLLLPVTPRALAGVLSVSEE